MGVARWLDSLPVRPLWLDRIASLIGGRARLPHRRSRAQVLDELLVRVGRAAVRAEA